MADLIDQLARFAEARVEGLDEAIDELDRQLEREIERETPAGSTLRVDDVAAEVLQLQCVRADAATIRHGIVKGRILTGTALAFFDLRADGDLPDQVFRFAWSLDRGQPGPSGATPATCKIAVGSLTWVDPSF